MEYAANNKENIRYRSPSKLKIKPSSREFPSTPAGRVPLSDLIGNNEDSKDRTPQGSPVEAVSWNKSPQSSNLTQSFMTPMINRKRKRPRSASAGDSTEKRPTEQAKLQPGLALPQNDPAFDLESQYFGHRHRTPSKPASSAAPDFMTSSSPQTPAPVLVDIAKLKRTSSCGMAYPPGNKRRKAEVQLDLDLDLGPIAIPREGSGRNDGKMQEISWMLDSIHQDLPASLRISQPSPPTESCPEPMKTRTGLREKLDGGAVEMEQNILNKTANRAQEHILTSKKSRHSNQSSESDINDLGANLEALTEEDILALSAPSNNKDPKTIDSPQLPQQVFPEPASGSTNVRALEKQTLEPTFDDDVFDEFNDEEELEILASYCEPEAAQLSPSSPTDQPAVADDQLLQIDTESSCKRSIIKDIVEVSDDEFDAGIDDEFCDDLYVASQVPQQEPSVGHI